MAQATAVHTEETKRLRAMPFYAATLFIGAFLLFVVEPLIGKYILPWFGGSPGVWTICLLFFQTALLAGYAYAHLSIRCLSPKRQAWVHVALLLLAAAMLPIAPSASWKPTPGSEPTWRILALLGVCVGLPYTVLSATGPLLQAWLSRLNPGWHPYRLFALSNLASLLGLLSYPFLIEPALSRHTQAMLWSAAMGAFIVLSACCAVASMKRTSSSPEDGTLPQSAAASATGAPSPAAPAATALPACIGGAATQRLLWLCFPATASVLLLATTNKICQDIAVVPFLWVVPLALYLLSFILCFDNPRWYRRRIFAPALLVGMTGICVFQSMQVSIFWQLGVCNAALFVGCMLCHGELARLKPSPRHLTSYYLMIALGGALGGACVAIAAPLLFNNYYEWPLGLLGCVALALFAWWADPQSFIHRGQYLGALVVTLLVLGYLLLEPADSGSMVGRWRNFYGVLTIWDRFGSQKNEHVLVLENGQIMHGAQFTSPAKRHLATTYYAPSSGLGLAMRYFPRQENRRVGAIGLGTGTVASYARPGDYFRFYEINPQVVELARTRFHYLSDCAGQVEVVLGDARLSMENEPPQNLDLLVLDAFSGDSIPVHLLTRECFETYLRHCREDAVIAVHISNRHLDLKPVVRRLAEELGLRAARHNDVDPDPVTLKYGSEWVLLTRNDEFIRRAGLASAVAGKASGPPFRLWTDDQTSLFQILR